MRVLGRTGARVSVLAFGCGSRFVGYKTDEEAIAALNRALVFANHAFQPRTVVRRTDLAQAVARILARIAAKNPGRTKVWESARLTFSDLSPSHLAYPAASIAVAAGVMKTSGDNSFQPSRAVTGAEAIAAIENIEALARLR